MSATGNSVLDFPTEPSPDLTDYVYTFSTGKDRKTPLSDLKNTLATGERVLVDAVGDGVADDTAAVQAALDELEAGTVDHLHFPAGVYRLQTPSLQSHTSSSPENAMLVCGETAGFTGRDILITAAPGAVLYSNQGSTVSAGFSEGAQERCHILVILTKMRSLRVEGLRFEKDSTQVQGFDGAEPNGCDGVSLVQFPEATPREIEKVSFQNCVFFNTHGAVRTYNSLGNDVRGKLKIFEMSSCDVLNPYGSNATRGDAPLTGAGKIDIWGGGQQVNLGPWCQTARITGTRFQGGADVMDLTKCKEGTVKDAAFFGSPMRLIFTGNTVENFGIETVYILAYSNVLARKVSATLVMPPDDDTTTISFAVRDTFEDSTFEAGMVITLENTSGDQAQLIVTAWDEETLTVTAKNSGLSGNLSPGSNITGSGRVYHDIPADQFALVSNNSFTHAQPTNADTKSGGQAVVTEVRAMVSGNTISGYVLAVKSLARAVGYSENDANSCLISGNVIEMINRDDYKGDDVNYNASIYLESGNCVVSGNTIIAPKAAKQFGIRVMDSGNRIKNNSLVCLDNALLNAAIAEDVSTTGNYYSGNVTQGWNYGISTTIFSGVGAGVIGSHESNGDANAFGFMPNAPASGVLAGYDAAGRLVPSSGKTQLVRLAADEERDATTTFASSPTLTVPLEALAKYRFKLWFRYTTFNASAYGIRTRFAIPSGSTVRASYSLTQDGSAVETGDLITNITATATTTKATSTGSTDDCTICIEGTISTSITPDDFTLEWAQNTLGVADRETTIKSGSYFEVTKIP